MGKSRNEAADEGHSTARRWAWSLRGDGKTIRPGENVLFIPVVLVLIAENIGHVKSVAAMTGRDLDALTGRTLFADGCATILAGSGGGSGTTTYAENIGVMAATRIFSTAAIVFQAMKALARWRGTDPEGPPAPRTAAGVEETAAES